MKRIAILAVCFATLAMSACSIFNSASSDSVAVGLGRTCGTAVLGLYQSYKKTGTVDLTNANNLTNALALATCYTQVKQNINNSSYRQSFTTGLISSSAGLITNQNAAAFVNLFLSSTALGTVNSSSSTAQVNGTTPTFTRLMKSLD